MFRLLSVCNSCENLKTKKTISLIKCFDCFRKKSYYEILGLNRSASAKDIKSAYYQLSLQFHPDKNNGSLESVAKFREISEAYEVLGNPEKRKLYDQTDTFQNQYSSNQSFNKHYYRPRGYTGPYTGKTRDFNYEEHFRKHYQDFEKTRNAEHEYFRRRWEAEYYRRYPNYDKHFKNEKSHYEFRRQFILRRRSYVLFVSLWLLLIIIQGYKDLFDQDGLKVKRRVYYEVNQADDKEKSEV